MLIWLDEQQVESMLKSLVRHMCSREGFDKTYEDSGVNPTYEIFRGPVVWGMPGLPLQSKGQIIVSYTSWRRKHNAQWASKVSGGRLFHIWEYYSYQYIGWMNGNWLSINMFNNRPPLKCKLLCFLPIWSSRSYGIRSTCDGKTTCGISGKP